jgi:formate dehydrogenase subunit gamma
MAADPPARLRRFSPAERALHWLLAGSFFVLLGTGLILYLPSLSGLVARPTAKVWHIDAALALGAGTIVLLLTRWRTFRRTFRQFDRFDRDDVRWLLGAPRRLVRREPSPPQGRFNAGQKLNAALVGGLMLVSFATGFLLWFGERDTRYRFAGTVMVHDWVMWLLIVLVAGHLYLALVHPTTRHALRGMTLGDVDREWARRHHPKWAAADDRRPERPAPPGGASGRREGGRSRRRVRY